jgi:hypothetical protein
VDARIKSGHDDDVVRHGRIDGGPRKRAGNPSFVVIAGLDPAIHIFTTEEIVANPRR